MGNFSRDSFQDTKNALNELLGLVAPGAPGVHNYVGVRLQQAVPMVDADWNEEADIRRLELEYILAQGIGNGVPASSNGFNISAVSLPNNFAISAGVIFVQGWLVYNRQLVTYDAQPYQASPGVAPPPPLPVLQPPAVATNFLAYLDAWEFEVSSTDDVNLIDNRIGIETCVRLERGWLVRVAALATNANPLDPASIPNQQPGHRYYPLALIARQPIPQIGAGMITDLRRTSLSLDVLTHAPLLVYNPVLDQRLNSQRLALMFRSNLDILQAVLTQHPEVFVYTTQAVDTAQATTALQDVRALATSLEQQARAVSLYREAAFSAMQSFYGVESTLLALLTQFNTAGVAVGFTPTVISAYSTNLNGSSVTDPTSVNFALQNNDVLGAVLAQERLNQTLSQTFNILPEGSLVVNLVAVTPTTPVTPNTTFQLTLQIANFLTSTLGKEDILLIATAGPGWSTTFQDSGQSELVVNVLNGSTQETVLNVIAAPAAAPTNLILTARPVRRQQLVYQNPPVALAIGQSIISGSPIIVTLVYTGTTLQTGNVASVPRSAMFAGISIPWRVTNLSAVTETYQIAATPQSAATGWQTPAATALAPLAPTAFRDITFPLKTTDQLGAVSPLTFQFELTRITGGANNPQPNTIFNLTFQLTPG